MSRAHQRYCALRTMEELRNERIRMHKRKRQNMLNIMEDAEELKYAVSPSGIANTLFTQACHSSTFFRKMAAGAIGAVKWMRRRKRRKDECPYR